MRTRDRIVLLLTSYRDALEGWAHSPEPGSGRHESVLLRLPALWYAGSYLELCCSLLRMREAEPQLYSHLARRYLTCEVRPMTVPVHRSKRGARPILGKNMELVSGAAPHTGRQARVVVRRWSSKVKPELVEEALAFLERDMYGGRSDLIRVPRELLDEEFARVTV